MNKKLKIFSRSLSMIALLSSCIAQPVLSAQLEEIVVTAQKRSESIMDVPISITALSSDVLEKANITSTDDLQAIVPGVEFRKQITAFTPFIRGIGAQSAAVGVDMSIAMYVDGIYQSLGAANAINFNNLERIEVLKGPQGTLFGRNATGGAINIITKNPEHETYGKVKLGYGNYETVIADLYATTGVTDTLATNISISYLDQNEGFSKHLLTGDDIRQQESLSLRNKWLWTPSENTTVNLSLTYEDSTGAASGITRHFYDGAIGAFGDTATGGYYDSQESYIAGVNTGNSKYDGEDAARESLAATLRVDHSFNNFDFVSITGYMDQEVFSLVDQDSGPVPGLDVSLSWLNEQVSQEIQFLSNGDGPFSWFAGLYYMNAKHSYDPLRLAGLAFAPLAYISIGATVETTSLAAFAEGAYELTDKTKLTVGLRWTDDEKELYGATDFAIAPNIVIASSPYNEKKSWTEPTWRIVLDHDINDSLMGYASYSRGFKSGSFNGVITSGIPEAPVEPEILDAIEIGLKGQLLDNTLAFSAAAFYYEFENIQVSQQVTGGSRSTNAADSEIQGVELSGQFLATDNLSFSGGFAYTDAKFTSFLNGPSTAPTGVGGNFIISADLTGNRIPRTPEWSANLSMDYSTDTSIGLIDTNISYYYNGGFFWESDNRPGIEQESYSLVSATLRWTDSSETYGVELWAKNLTDEEYQAFGTSSQLGDIYNPAPPRTYGLTLFANF